MTAERLLAEGDVEEREELLDGRVQVALGGAAGETVVACTLVWRLGRTGDVPLEEGFLTLEGADGGSEVNASLDDGSVAEQPETGAATVRATFVVDAASGGRVREGARLRGEFEVGSERWTAALVIELEGEPAG